MTMKIIELEPQFWELYQQGEQLYLSIAIDVSSVVSCWDMVLTQAEIEAYQNFGRTALVELTKKLVNDVFRGNFSRLESNLAATDQKRAMQITFKNWQNNQR